MVGALGLYADEAYLFFCLLKLPGWIGTCSSVQECDCKHGTVCWPHTDLYSFPTFDRRYLEPKPRKYSFIKFSLFAHSTTDQNIFMRCVIFYNFDVVLQILFCRISARLEYFLQILLVNLIHGQLQVIVKTLQSPLVQVNGCYLCFPGLQRNLWHSLIHSYQQLRPTLLISGAIISTFFSLWRASSSDSPNKRIGSPRSRKRLITCNKSHVLSGMKYRGGIAD